MTLVGVFYSFTALIFSYFIFTWTFPTITPRIGISSMLKSYLDLLKHRLCFSAIFKNQIVLSSSCFFISAGITKSSIWFASTPSCNNSWKMLFIILWNVSGKLHSPKYITCGSNNPLFIKNEAFYLSSSLIHTLLYPQIKSSLLKNFASFSLSITSLIKKVVSCLLLWLDLVSYNLEPAVMNYLSSEYKNIAPHILILTPLLGLLWVVHPTIDSKLLLPLVSLYRPWYLVPLELLP